ncbi:MAG: transcriptional regulator, LytR family [Anaerocolumna sp.]|jgi:ABC-2 type transport system ATP-binding protein|nr:transcriptional regulator, LytR family [Anaerocolumna sp.]
MLTISGLYKESNKKVIRELTITVENNTSVSIECDSETQSLLMDLILGKELPARGEILIDHMPVREYYDKYSGTVGIIFKDDALYENMTVDGYLKFFSELLSSIVDYKAVMLDLALLDIGSIKIKKLSYTQKRRVSLAREILKSPSLLLIQEPILNLDKDGMEIIIENIQKLCDKGTAVLLTSVLLKDTLMVGNKAYRLDDKGCNEISAAEESPINASNTLELKQTYTIEKIPAKIEDKILLFDPMEIDYIESGEGISFLLIRGEKFPCNLTLAELEIRLKFFGFFRSHRSYLVNLQRVREVVTWTRNSYSLNLDDKIKSSIPLSKGRLEELKNILNF